MLRRANAAVDEPLQADLRVVVEVGAPHVDVEQRRDVLAVRRLDLRPDVPLEAVARLIKDINLLNGNAVPLGLAAFGSSVVFSAKSAGKGAEPWISDGSVAGTVSLGDLYPGPSGSAGPSDHW